MRLEMQTPHSPRLDAQRLIVLNEFDRSGALLEIGEPERLGKVASLVLDLARYDFQWTVKAQGAEFHLDPVDFRWRDCRLDE
jgi:hypothetical protein